MADGDSVVSAAEAYIIGPRARVECSPLQAGHSGNLTVGRTRKEGAARWVHAMQWCF
jgi:hypothetical protein